MVDATDRLRIDDCREELAGLLLEEVGQRLGAQWPIADGVTPVPSGLWEPASSSSRTKSTLLEA